MSFFLSLSLSNSVTQLGGGNVHAALGGIIERIASNINSAASVLYFRATLTILNYVKQFATRFRIE